MTDASILFVGLRVGLRQRFELRRRTSAIRWLVRVLLGKPPTPPRPMVGKLYRLCDSLELHAADVNAEQSSAALARYTVQRAPSAWKGST